MLYDLRGAIRTLVAAPGFTLSAVLALGLGLGANIAVFSVVYAVLLRPLPYSEADRLVRLYEVNRVQGAEPGDVSAGTFVDWRSRTRTLESMAVYTSPSNGETLWSFGERFEAIRTTRVSPGLFSMLRVAPIRGRTFAPETEQTQSSGESRQVVISYGLWQRAFAGSDVIGRTVSIEGRFPAEIIGVMPRGFAFPEGTDAWANQAFVGPLEPARRRAIVYHALGRLAPGKSIREASAELAAISAQLAIEQPNSNAGWSAYVVPYAGSDTRTVKPALLALLAAVAGVLLIACANVANLALARATGRRHEIAIRVAIGASISRIVRQSFAEALALSALGTIVGLVLGQWISHLLVRLAPPDIPRLGDVAMNQSVLFLGIGMGLFCSATIALAPAAQASRDIRAGLRPDVRSATPRSSRVRVLLMGSEMAIVVLLLTGALLLVRTFANLCAVDLGFQAAPLVNVETRWPIGRLFPEKPGVSPWPHIQRAVDGLVDAIARVEGVDAAGLISEVPLTGEPFSGGVWRADAPGAHGLTAPIDPRDRWRADLSVVTPSYFSAMSIALVHGRYFTVDDRYSEEQLNRRAASRIGVALVNSALASRYFHNQDPVGQSLVVYDDQEFGPIRTIVGVVADVHGRTVAEPARPTVFIPHGQHPDVFTPSIVVRSTLPLGGLAPAIRRAVDAYDPQLLIQRIRPMDEIVSDALSRPRFNVVLLGSFAVVALALSAVGIYSVLASLIALRTRELGIRIALGARATDVIRVVAGEVVTSVACGGSMGVLAALVSTRVLRAMLFGVSPFDPVSLVAAPAVLAGVALLACYVPARRALRVDPLVALRED